MRSKASFAELCRLQYMVTRGATPPFSEQVWARGLLPLLAGGDQFFDVDQLRGVVAGVAGVAVFVLLVVGYGLAEGTDGEIADGIGFHETADLLYAVVGGDQLATRGPTRV